VESIEIPSCRWRRLNLLSAVLLIGGIAGCNKPPYDLAPARGHVTLDGKPLSAAKVMFAPIANGESIKSGKPAFGLLDSDGAFILGTYSPEDGAIIGEHWVTIIRMPAERNQMPGNDSAKSGSGVPKTGWDRVMFPQPLTVSADGENDFKIALTSEIVIQHGHADE